MPSLGQPEEKISIMIKNNLLIFVCMPQIMKENSAVLLADLTFYISTLSQNICGGLFTDKQNPG